MNDTDPSAPLAYAPQHEAPTIGTVLRDRYVRRFVTAQFATTIGIFLPAFVFTALTFGFIGKLRAYAEWWAGSAEALTQHEASPALAPLEGLPPALMFCGTRDLLVPGCRLLQRRAQEAGWDLTYVEEPDLLHVYPLLPFVPEARRAWGRTLEFLR